MIVKESVVLAPYTVCRIGGSARFLIEVRNGEELREAVSFARSRDLPFFILGSGSNVLVSDKGFDGVVIRLHGGEVVVDGEKLTVDAGVAMARAVHESAKAGLTGLEWGIGIPGTIGGSVRGNAGCFGGEMKDIVEAVDVYDSVKATSYKLKAKSCEFAYRDSIFKRHPAWIILSATLRLSRGDPRVIQETIKRITAERIKKQDIGTQSCGCIFQNIPWSRKDINKEKLLARFPELAQFADMPGIPASYLIDQAGLKWRQMGGVFVSPKHANYFVNAGEATAEEVVMLIAASKDIVQRKFGVFLEEEIQYVGFL